MQQSEIFQSKVFARFARKARISDEALLKAIKQAESGLIDAELGGNVIKQRIAREGGGKSGGSRTIVLFRSGSRAVFVHGFEKKDVSTIDAQDLLDFRKLAAILLNMSTAEINALVDREELVRVGRGGQPDGE